MLEDVDAWILAASLDEGAFDLFTGDIAGMDHAAFLVSAFSPEVEFILVRLILVAEFSACREMCSDFREPPDAFRTRLHDAPDAFRVAEMVARVDGVGNMFVEGVLLIRDAGDAPLREPAVAVFHGAFRDNGDFPCAFFRKHQSAGKTGKTAPDDQMLKKYFLIGIHFFYALFPFALLLFA